MDDSLLCLLPRAMYVPPAKRQGQVQEENSNGGGQPCKIFYIDYGNMENVSSEELRKLRKEFYDVPAQAILCKIHGIKPIESKWSPEATAYFKSLVEDVPLTLVVESKSMQAKLIGVDLITNDEESICEKIVEKGYAVWEDPKRFEQQDENTKPLTNGVGSSPESGSSPKKGSLLRRLTNLSLEEKNTVNSGSHVELPDQTFLDVFISNISKKGEVSFILLGPEYQGRLTVLEGSMITFYEDETQGEISSVDIGKYYAASSDDSWYRVKVLDVQGDKVEVLFLDHGDQSVVKRSELRKLPPLFTRLPFQAITCTLCDIPEINDPDVIQHLTDLSLGKEVVAYIVERGSSENDKPVIELYDTTGEQDININQEVMTKLTGESHISLEPVLPKAGEQTEAYVMHITDSGQFFIQIPGPGLQRLDELTEELANHFSKGGKASEFVSKPEVGKICCTKCSRDSLMHRVEITCVMTEERKVEVEVIDYGKREVISLQMLREIPSSLSELITVPRQSLKCELAAFPEELKNVWKDGFANRMVNELQTHTVTLEVVNEGTDSELPQVMICKSKEDDSTELINIIDEIKESLSNSRKSSKASSEGIENVGIGDQKEGALSSRTESPDITTQVCLVPDLVLDDLWIDVTVVWAKDPSKFAIQLLQNVDKLEQLQKELNGFCQETSVPLEFPRPGDLCSAYHPDYECWYRGIIQSAPIEDEVCVRFADFGDLNVVPLGNVYQLDSQFHSLPFQAIRSSLSGVQPKTGMKSWSSDTSKKFVNLVLNKYFVAHITGPFEKVSNSYSLNSLTVTTVRLYDTSESEEDVLINDLIIAEGLATRKC